MQTPEEIKITSDIPIPPGRFALDGTLHKLRTVFATMQIGDSFLWPTSKPLFDAARQTKVKITTRKINGAGIRVWRVK